MGLIIKQVYIRIRNRIAIAARLLLLQPQAATIMTAGVTSFKTEILFPDFMGSHGYNIDRHCLAIMTLTQQTQQPRRPNQKTLAQTKRQPRETHTQKAARSESAPDKKLSNLA